MYYYKLLIMMSRITNFFTDCGEVITSPEDLFYVKRQYGDHNGIWSLIFFSVFLALIIGLAIGDLTLTGILVFVLLVCSLIFKFIQAILIYLFARLLGGHGEFIDTFNLISYSSVLDIFLILGIACLTLGKLVIIPLLLLLVLWKMVIVITAVNSEYDIGYGKSFLSAYGIILLIFTIIVGLL